MTITEWRGVTDLVAAEVTEDSSENYTTGTVFEIAGVASIEKSTDGSSEAHSYNNIPAVVVSGRGADTLTINVSALSLEVQARLNGQEYDSTLGAMIEGEPEQKYFAIGYKTQKVDGTEVYVWRYKGSFAPIGSTHNTIDNGTTANGQELTYTGIATTHKFTKTGKGATGINVDLGLDLADVDDFFATVTTPDTLVPKTSYKLTITQAANTTVTVKRGSQTLANNADIYAGDELKITVTGGTVTVGGVAFTSGDIHVVTGATAVVSTASA